jgi:hypothetical protein
MKRLGFASTLYVTLRLRYGNISTIRCHTLKESCLVCPLRRGHERSVVSLLNHRTDPNVRDSRGVSALSHAAGSAAAGLLRKAGAKD